MQDLLPTTPTLNMNRGSSEGGSPVDAPVQDSGSSGQRRGTDTGDTSLNTAAANKNAVRHMRHPEAALADATEAVSTAKEQNKHIVAAGMGEICEANVEACDKSTILHHVAELADAERGLLKARG